MPSNTSMVFPRDCRCLQQERRHCGDQDGLSDAARSVASDVARDFSASGGVANQRDLIEIESVDHCRKIVA